MRTFICSLILVLFGCNVKAQKQLDTFLSNLVMVDLKLYLSEDYKDKSYIFCIGMEIGKSGKVENVIFSNKSKLFIGRLIDFPKIEDKLKKERNLFKSSKKQFLVLPIFIIRGDSKISVNLDEMEQLWKGMIDDLKRKEQRPTLLLPRFMKFSGEVIVN